MARGSTWSLARAGVLLPVLLHPHLSAALHPIEVQSQDFVETGTGNRFEIIGVDYQPGGSAGFDPKSGKDPLSDEDICIRDAALMQKLGLNTIRTYNVDPYINHDACASIFNAVGIYILVDVNSPLPGGSIDRSDPGPSYTLDYLNRTFAVIEAFRNYPNLAGFFSANEVINDEPTAEANPPYIRAVTRDLKAYIAARGGRTIPVGYSAADVRPILVDTSNYLQCNITSEKGMSSRSDFFALNSYSWCGPSATFESSTYNELASDFAATTMPVFFSEFGCIVPPPRYFNEIPVLYGPQMTTWSGGLVYEWTEEGSGYGLVDVNSDGSISLTDDFNTLQGKYSGLNFTLIESQNATAQMLTPPDCSSKLISTAGFSTDFSIPDPPSGANGLISQGVDGVKAGKIQPVTKTVVDVVVTQVNGQTSRGLTITLVSSAIRPDAPSSDLTKSRSSRSSRITSATPTSSSTTSTSSPAPSSTTSNAAAPGTAFYAGGSQSPMFGLPLASIILWLLG